MDRLELDGLVSNPGEPSSKRLFSGKTVPMQPSTFCASQLPGTGPVVDMVQGIALPPRTHIAFSPEQVDFAITALVEPLEALARASLERTGHRLTPLVLLEGGRVFSAAILPRCKSLEAPQYLKVKSYSSTIPGQSGRTVRADGLETLQIKGDALILDDILDEGLTAGTVRDALLTRGVPQVETVVLIQREVSHQVVSPTLVGIRTNSQEWFVGMGLDLNGELRELNYVLAMPPGSI